MVFLNFHVKKLEMKSLKYKLSRRMKMIKIKVEGKELEKGKTFKKN